MPVSHVAQLHQAYLLAADGVDACALPPAGQRLAFGPECRVGLDTGAAVGRWLPAAVAGWHGCNAMAGEVEGVGRQSIGTVDM